MSFPFAGCKELVKTLSNPPCNDPVSFSQHDHCIDTKHMLEEHCTGADEDKTFGSVISKIVTHEGNVVKPKDSVQVTEIVHKVTNTPPPALSAAPQHATKDMGKVCKELDSAAEMAKCGSEGEKHRSCNSIRDAQKSAGCPIAPSSVEVVPVQEKPSPPPPQQKPHPPAKVNPPPTPVGVPEPTPPKKSESHKKQQVTEDTKSSLPQPVKPSHNPTTPSQAPKDKVAVVHSSHTKENSVKPKPSTITPAVVKPTLPPPPPPTPSKHVQPHVTKDKIVTPVTQVIQHPQHHKKLVPPPPPAPVPAPPPPPRQVTCEASCPTPAVAPQPTTVVVPIGSTTTDPEIKALQDENDRLEKARRDRELRHLKRENAILKQLEARDEEIDLLKKQNAQLRHKASHARQVKDNQINELEKEIDFWKSKKHTCTSEKPHEKGLDSVAASATSVKKEDTSATQSPNENKASVAKPKPKENVVVVHHHHHHHHHEATEPIGKVLPKNNPPPKQVEEHHHHHHHHHSDAASPSSYASIPLSAAIGEKQKIKSHSSHKDEKVGGNTNSHQQLGVATKLHNVTTTHSTKHHHHHHTKH